MKKIAVFILSVFLFTANLFAQNFQVFNVDTDNIYDVFDSLEKGQNYSINFAEDFDFSKLDEEFFQYRMIEKLHDLFINGSYLKFTGPFDYIYFDGIQSVNNFSVIKTQIVEHPEKYYCVDISESSYLLDFDGNRILLPINCFAGHKNLYWVYFGKFLGENITAGVCSNLPNLQAAFFWDEAEINASAFTNSNPEALYVCGECGLVMSLSSYVNDASDEYDYLKFTSAYEYDPYSGVSWLIDGDEDCYYGWWEQDWWEDDKKTGTTVPSYNDDSVEDYNSFPLIEDDDYCADEYDDYWSSEEDDEEISDEELLLFINMMTAPLVEEFSWDLLGESTEINKDTKPAKNPVELEDVATAFIISYLKGDKNYKKYAVISEDGKIEEEGMQAEINTFKDYGEVKNVLLLNQLTRITIEDDNSAVVNFGVEYEKDGQIEKEITIMELERIEGSWKVTKLNNSYLRVFLFSLLISSY